MRQCWHCSHNSCLHCIVPQLILMNNACRGHLFTPKYILSCYPNTTSSEIRNSRLWARWVFLDSTKGHGGRVAVIISRRHEELYIHRSNSRSMFLAPLVGLTIFTEAWSQVIMHVWTRETKVTQDRAN